MNSNMLWPVKNPPLRKQIPPKKQTHEAESDDNPSSRLLYNLQIEKALLFSSTMIWMFVSFPPNFICWNPNSQR